MIKCIPAVYSVLFNVKMVVGILEGDINHGAKELTRALAEMGDEAATLQSIMTAVIRDKGGVEGVRTSKEPTTCKSILWLNRATTFITMFIRGLHDGKESKVAASTAYDTVLKPYHGFMTKKVPCGRTTPTTMPTDARAPPENRPTLRRACACGSAV